MVYLGLDAGMCKECYYFNGAHCTNCDICWDNSLFNKNEIKQVKERTHVNMFVDDMKKEETVNHPSHYNKGIEAIEYIESHNFNFNLGNAIKYITRCEHKNSKSEDIEKAIWYLERELKKGE